MKTQNTSGLGLEDATINSFPQTATEHIKGKNIVYLLKRKTVATICKSSNGPKKYLQTIKVVMVMMLIATVYRLFAHIFITQSIA